MQLARTWSAATLVTVTVALVLQLVLVVDGAAVLVEGQPPGLGLRVARFFAYFTVQSNLLVALTLVPLVRDPHHDGPWWRTLRTAAVMGISATALVHFFLLRPLLALEGWSSVADTLLHVVVPPMVILGWFVWGPRPRTTWSVVLTALCWPVLWLAATVAVGAATGWFPYPFLDFRADGWGPVAVASLGVAVLVLGLLSGMRWWDAHARPTSRAVG